MKVTPLFASPSVLSSLLSPFGGVGSGAISPQTQAFHLSMVWRAASVQNLAHTTRRFGPDILSFVHEALGVHEELTDRSEGTETPHGLLQRIKSDFDGLCNIVGGEGEMSAASLDAFRRESQVIAERIEYWERALQEQMQAMSQERSQFQEDILFGEQLLMQQLASLTARALTPALMPSPAVVPRRLHRRWAKHPFVGGAHGKRGKRLPGLMNYDVGYGQRLSLRPHQIFVHQRIRGAFKALAQRLQNRTSVAKEALHGTVVMPVGGGKTRNMVAAFAAALEDGLWKPEAGEIGVVLNHLERIHRQNREMVRGLGTSFRRRLGRTLKITEYKGEQRNVSGDIVVISIPTVSTPEARRAIVENLQKSFAGQGRVAIIAVDEAHHIELGRKKTKGSWRELIAALKSISPHAFELRFTATPTGREGPYLAWIREETLMKAGVTPRTYLVKVDGVNLNQLKISRDAEDFAVKELSSVLLQHPERNERLFAQLETHGLRQTTSSPSGRARLMGSIGFAADLRHATMMADDYVRYFGTSGGEGDLRGRKIVCLGRSRGEITADEWRGAQEAYRRGEVDAVVAVVSGTTSERLRDEILKASEQGEVETVFNVDVWREGADLYMFTHLLGGRPTFSPYVKGQERGRLNRRGPHDVSRRGWLRNDLPKIIFDVIDRYERFDRHLIRYGDCMGIIGHASLETGKLLGILEGGVVAGIDRDGKDLVHAAPGAFELPPKPPARPAATSLSPAVEKLWEVFEKKYDKDAQRLALDLGIPVIAVEGLLEGRGWINARWFLRRLATLLYEDRALFTAAYRAGRSEKDSGVTDGDRALLRAGLRIYEAWEGDLVEGRGLVVHDPDFGKELRLNAHLVQTLDWETIGDLQWRRLWRGLLVYFSQVGQGSSDPDRIAIAKAVEARFVDHIWLRLGWERDEMTGRGRLLGAFRDTVAQKFGGVIPQDISIAGLRSKIYPDAALVRWLNGQTIEWAFSRRPLDFYDDVRIFLKSMSGLTLDNVESLIEEAIFEERDWPRHPKTAPDRLLFEAHRVVARCFGGAMTHKLPFAGSKQTSQAALTQWLADGKISRQYPEVYDQIRKLLAYGGVGAKRIDNLFEAVGFERRGWPRKSTTHWERLCYAGRQVVARKFGGYFPANPPIENVPTQNSLSTMTRWIDMKPIAWSHKLPAQNFYTQVRSVLRYGDVSEPVIDALIEAAVFEERKWSKAVKTAREKLRHEARRVVARAFGGVLPTHPPIDGLPKQDIKAALWRWLEEPITWDKILSSHRLYGQIRCLLEYGGLEAPVIEGLISTAIAEDIADEVPLRHEANGVVIRLFGGRLPRNRRRISARIPSQSKDARLTEWLEGRSAVMTPRLQRQIRALIAMGE